MPTKKTLDKVEQMKREGKSPQAQAGEFVRAEIEEIRDHKHGARSTKQVIAIGLSEARRAGVELPAPKKGKYGNEVREKAQHDLEVGKEPDHKVSPTRSRATTKALQKEGTNAASHAALSRQAKSVSNRRTAAEKSESARKAASARTPEERSGSAQEAARTRKRNQDAG
jgi:hypothetical protein